MDADLYRVEVLAFYKDPETGKRAIENGKYQLTVQYNARFVRFGTDIEEGENGFASFSTVIVVKDDGKLESIPVAMIRFLEGPLTSRR